MAETRAQRNQRIRTYRSHGVGREKKAAYDKAYAAKNRDKIRQRALESDPAPDAPAEFCCRKCGQTKPFTTEFFTYRPGMKYKLTYNCRTCLNEKSLNWQTMKRYGLTAEEARQLRARASCAICQSTDNVHIDHCHTSGKVRDVLCSKCNTAIGQFDEDPERMRAAAAYIEGHKNVAP